MSNCILYDCGIVCDGNCSQCSDILGRPVDKTVMYKYAYIDGCYTVCCPACKQIKHDVHGQDMIQGDCEHCDKRGDEEE